MTEIKLFSYRRCPFAIRVRMALYEKQVEFETIEEDLKNKSEELLRLHPEGRVPLLIHNGLVIYESSVITEYVNEVFAGVDLMPSSFWLKALVRMHTVWCNNILKPEIDRLKYEKTEDAKLAAANQLTSHIKRLEDTLLQSNYLVGDSFTLADIHLFPFLRQITIAKPELLDREKFKKTFAWFEQISKRSCFEKAMYK